MDAIFAALEALSDKGQPVRGQPLPERPAQPAAASLPQKAAPVSAPKPEPKHEEPKVGHVQAGALQGMFEDGNTLLRAVIASEVLGPPVSLRENHFWNQQPNEPST